jgi:hypothetical protein
MPVFGAALIFVYGLTRLVFGTLMLGGMAKAGVYGSPTSIIVLNVVDCLAGLLGIVFSAFFLGHRPWAVKTLAGVSLCLLSYEIGRTVGISTGPMSGMRTAGDVLERVAALVFLIFASSTLNYRIREP